jgi:hypothetical protein
MIYYRSYIAERCPAARFGATRVVRAIFMQERGGAMTVYLTKHARGGG